MTRGNQKIGQSWRRIAIILSMADIREGILFCCWLGDAGGEIFSISIASGLVLK